MLIINHHILTRLAHDLEQQAKNVAQHIAKGAFRLSKVHMSNTLSECTTIQPISSIKTFVAAEPRVP